MIDRDSLGAATMLEVALDRVYQEINSSDGANVAEILESVRQDLK